MQPSERDGRTSSDALAALRGGGAAGWRRRAGADHKPAL